MHRHMSFVDCSYIKDQPSRNRYSHGLAGQRSHVVALLGLPKANVLRGQTDDISFAINYTSPSRSRTHFTNLESAWLH